jgi:hypothetical protein
VEAAIVALEEERAAEAGGTIITVAEEWSPVGRVRKCEEWMGQLGSLLLNTEVWEEEERDRFFDLVDEIWQLWEKVTKTRPTPKLHMLKHAAAFASGRVWPQSSRWRPATPNSTDFRT